LPLRIAEKAALSDVGRARQSNEDSYLERSPLFVVADGMGGARAGEVASAIAVETAGSTEVGESPEQDLAEVAKTANREIYRKAQDDAEHAGMGTTFTGAFVTNNGVSIGHVGDSRMYRLRDGELERLTHDHSLVEEFVRQGKLTPEEAEVHPQRSIITRALGPEPDVQVDTFTYPGRNGAIYLMCSDGLTGMISENHVADILRRSETLDEAAKSLIDAANEGGGRDNITVVLFRLEGEADEEGEEEDTLGGQATKVGVSTETVAAAVREADEQEERAAPARGTETKPHDRPKEPAAGARPSAAGTRRDDTRLGKTLEGGVPKTSPIAARRAPPISRRRRIVAAVSVLLIAAVAVFAVWFVARQFWFVGTTEAGQVALYRGLPYELPLGIDLYQEEYASGMPARAIPTARRDRVLDHQWRSRDDAIDLVRALERGQIDAGTSN
jgi:PPM family protein phosphatase